jgi:hypothetical protein
MEVRCGKSPRVEAFFSVLAIYLPKREDSSWNGEIDTRICVQAGAENFKPVTAQAASLLGAT